MSACCKTRGEDPGASEAQHKPTEPLNDPRAEAICLWVFVLYFLSRQEVLSGSESTGIAKMTGMLMMIYNTVCHIPDTHMCEAYTLMSLIDATAPYPFHPNGNIFEHESRYC